MYKNIFIKNYKKDKGFTLLEMLISLAIFSIVVGLVGTLARDTFYFEKVFSGGLTSYDEARKILQPVSSEIRAASPSSLGSYPIETATATNFAFFTDNNNDGIKERIRYFLSGNTLTRGVINPTGNPLQYLSGNEVLTEVAHGLVNNSTAIFTYYDSNYTGSSTPLTQPVSVLNIHLVKITLIIDADPNRPPASVTVTTQVNIRNLKDNL